MWISDISGYAEDMEQSITVPIMETHGKNKKSGVNELLGSIVFVNQKEGWAAGVKGNILHTTDSGETWTAQKSGMEFNILDLFF